jgi:hypothetical protein
MEEMAKHGESGLASRRAGMDRATGRKYRRLKNLPSELRQPRTWWTRPDLLAEDWPEIGARLAEAPELEGLALFEDLMTRRPGRYQEGQIRTFQRRVKDWRARNGPEKEVFFPRITDLGRRSKRTSPMPRNWASRSRASPSPTCCAMWWRPTRTGSGRRRATRNPCWPCAGGSRRPCSNLAGFRDSTRRTIPRRRPTISQPGSGASTRLIWR